ncbi:hypothetical protein GF325_16415 [Candidatus Bathyarchaeota archaeon]|nr:hypothetical protein [Candidatus Bathyarchaeota archaeon]
MMTKTPPCLLGKPSIKMLPGRDRERASAPCMYVKACALIRQGNLEGLAMALPSPQEHDNVLDRGFPWESQDGTHWIPLN